MLLALRALQKCLFMRFRANHRVTETLKDYLYIVRYCSTSTVSLGSVLPTSKMLSKKLDPIERAHTVSTKFAKWCSSAPPPQPRYRTNNAHDTHQSSIPRHQKSKLCPLRTIGARPTVRNPENKKSRMLLGSFTLTSTMITVRLMTLMLLMICFPASYYGTGIRMRIIDDL